MKKKGFTLIELLSVIVILAIISLITISVVSKLVNSAKLKAFKTKIYALESAAETYFEEEILDGDESVFKKGIDGTNSLTIHLNNKSEVKKLDIQGKTFNKGFVTITDEGKVSITAIEDNLCGQKLHSSSVINMLDIKEDFTCYLLNTATGETNIGTQDVLTAIQNLKNDVSELKNENADLKSSNQEMRDAIKNLNNNVVGSETALNKIYPVGSIYISTDLDTVEKVHNALGGTWEVYGNGKVLRSSTEKSGQTNDSTGNISLTTANLPEHNHSYTPSGTVSKPTFTGSAVTSGGNSANPSATFKGTAGTTGNQSANHTHTFSGTTGNQSANHTHSIPSLSGSTNNTGNHTHGIYGGYESGWSTSIGGANSSNIWGIFPDSKAYNLAHMVSNGAHSHTVSTTASTTGGNSANHNHSYNGTTSGTSANHTHSFTPSGSVSLSGSHTHSVTAAGTVSQPTFTGTKSNTESTGSNTAFSVLDPYITVYMYKRVK